MNVSKLIELSLKQLGILASGENADANEIADAIDALHGLLAQWATQKLYVYQVQNIEMNLTSRTHTLTEDIAMISDLAKLDDEEITMVRDTNETSVNPVVIYKKEASSWVFNLLKDAKKLEITAYTLPTNLEPSTELELPANYQRPLILTLAVEIAPMFGVEPTGTLIMNQRQAIEMLKRSNVTPLYAEPSDLPVGLNHQCYR